MVEDILGGFFILTALYLIYIDIKTYSLPNWGVSLVALLGIIYTMNGDASMMNAFVSRHTSHGVDGYPKGAL